MKNLLIGLSLIFSLQIGAKENNAGINFPTADQNREAIIGLIEYPDFAHHSMDKLEAKLSVSISTDGKILIESIETANARLEQYLRRSLNQKNLKNFNSSEETYQFKLIFE